MKDDDGGAAFPLFAEYEHASGATVREFQFGMSLRDYFAAKAMPLAWQDFYGRGQTLNANTAEADLNAIGDNAYRLADAMLRARAAQSPRAVADRHIASWTEGSGK